MSYYDKWDDRNREARRRGERDAFYRNDHRYEYDSFTERRSAYEDGYEEKRKNIERHEEERREEERIEQRRAQRRHEEEMMRQTEEDAYYEAQQQQEEEHPEGPLPEQEEPEEKP